MAVNLNPQSGAGIDKAVGLLLVRVAVEAQSELRRELSRSYPPPSIAAEFPRGRTWNLREGAGVYEPADPMKAGKAGRVRIGYTSAAFYGAILELFRDRLGLVEVLKRLRGRLKDLRVTGLGRR
jgi:hypothetical protein